MRHGSKMTFQQSAKLRPKIEQFPLCPEHASANNRGNGSNRGGLAGENLMRKFSERGSLTCRSWSWATGAGHQLRSALTYASFSEGCSTPEPRVRGLRDSRLRPKGSP